MDSIPNEILLQIIGCLGKEIPDVRLVSNRFYLVATECMQKLFHVKFAKDSDIAKFVTMFENKAVVPFEKYGFSGDLLVYGEPLEQFCVQFGKLVKNWSLFGVKHWLYAGESSLSKNVQILLENCVNVEEIDLVVRKEIIDTFCTIPLLTNLRTITITCFDFDEDQFHLLNEIFEQAPNLRNVTIENMMGDSAFPATVVDILNRLYRIPAAVHIQTFYMYLDVPVTNVNDLKNLAAISTQFGIVDLELYMSVLVEYPEGLSQTEILSKWIQQLTSLRKLTLECFYLGRQNYPDRPHVPVTIPLRSLANIRSLKVQNLVYAPEVLQTEFPVLTSLMCRYADDIYQFSFPGCIFPNVKFARIELKTKEDYEQWPRVIPNVEELFVTSETLKGIFGFSKLRKLNISINSGSVNLDDPEVQMKHWNLLTGGADYVSDETICSCPVTTHKTSDSVDSFRNLPLLTELTFARENVECWKGIIFASRIGQLRRLEKLTFSIGYSTKEPYTRELMQYHDSVTVRKMSVEFLNLFW